MLTHPVLSHHPSFDKERDSITLLEATKIAGGASGKAGGLLALWAYPSCIVPLSYALHRELAEKHAGADRWGYRAVHCGQIDMHGVLRRDKAASSTDAREKEKEKDKLDSVSLKKRNDKALGMLRAAGVPQELDWVAAEGIRAYDEMGTPATTAQVHPYQFTTTMAHLAAERGVKIVYGSATRINQDGSGAVASVTYKPRGDGNDADADEQKTLEANTVILTAGPWTRTIWPAAPITAMRAHSVTIRPSRPVSAFCLFTSITLPRDTTHNARSKTVTPEIYARPNNEVYACGEADTLIPLPRSSDLVEVNESRCQDIVDEVRSISAELRDGEVTATQACYLPNVSDGGGPLIGATKVPGLLIGAGHTCWGIQNAPGTAKCLAELVWEGEIKSADLSSLDPKRYM